MAIDGGGQALRISEIFLETQNCTTPGCCVLFSLKYYYWTTTGLDYYYWTGLLLDDSLEQPYDFWGTEYLSGITLSVTLSVTLSLCHSVTQKIFFVKCNSTLILSETMFRFFPDIVSGRDIFRFFWT